MTRSPRTGFVYSAVLFACLAVLSDAHFLLGRLQAQRTEAAADARTAGNPILPGDHPDPTIIRVGTTYWTTSTSGGWAPEFPLFHSTDLRHWTAAGAIFPRTPSWATGDFWAPELVADHVRVLVYYVARKRGGPLCVAAATADRPQGPYTDHGPILCQPDGSIDPSFVRDVNGTPYLVWKEDANSIGQPTPIFAQPLSGDLLHLTGTKTELIHNEPATWEGGVVEGPYILRHAGRFYLFYAGNACCGAECHYAEGVARADHLLGPWQKDPANPIIVPNGAWKCPGHGTAVQDTAGHTYFVYHAYPAAGTISMGRESLLDRIDWSAEGWPVINAGRGPSGSSSTMADDAHTGFSDRFTERTLDPGWRWPIGYDPVARSGNGRLTIQVSPSGAPVFLARSLTSPDFVSMIVADSSDASGGLGIIGGVKTKLVLTRSGSTLALERDANGQTDTLWSHALPSAAPVWLRVTCVAGTAVTFSYSLDGREWTAVPQAESVAHFPAWDQGLRVGVVVSGAPGTHATFERFSMQANAPEASAGQ